MFYPLKYCQNCKSGWVEILKVCGAAVHLHTPLTVRKLTLYYSNSQISTALDAVTFQFRMVTKHEHVENQLKPKSIKLDGRNSDYFAVQH